MGKSKRNADSFVKRKKLAGDDPPPDFILPKSANGSITAHT